LEIHFRSCVVHVRAVKIYVAAVEAPRKNERGGEERMNSISPSFSANVSRCSLKKEKLHNIGSYFISMMLG
jgi:hypothetical protein